MAPIGAAAYLPSMNGPTVDPLIVRIRELSRELGLIAANHKVGNEGDRRRVEGLLAAVETLTREIKKSDAQGSLPTDSTASNSN